MTKIEFYVGVGTKANGEELTLSELLDGKRKALERLGEVFGGATVQRTEGVWKSPSGKLVVESSLTFLVYADLPTGIPLRVFRTARELGRIFGQLEVGMAVQDSSGAFSFQLIETEG